MIIEVYNNYHRNVAKSQQDFTRNLWLLMIAGICNLPHNCNPVSLAAKRYILILKDNSQYNVYVDLS